MNNYQLSSVHETNLTNQNGVYQDSLLTYAADRSGRFWALLGHTNLGGISVWSGSSLLDLKKEYDAQYCFALGEAGQAFSGIPYPDGPLSRGQIWPCGLWINKETNRFYCLIHNETGWRGENLLYRESAGGGRTGLPAHRNDDIRRLRENMAVFRLDSDRAGALLDKQIFARNESAGTDRR